MIKTTRRRENFATTCKSCGHRLTNPGYHQTSVWCCDKYRDWLDWWDEIIEIDDGRDERGRFHHAAKRLSVRRENLSEGGN